MSRRRLLAVLRRVWPKRLTRWRRAALRRTGNPADADDVVQEAIVRTLSAAPSVEDTWETDAYVMKAIRDMTIDKYRLRATRARGVNSFAVEHRGAARPSPLTKMLEREEHAQRLFALKLVREQVARLSPPHREAVELYFLGTPRWTLQQVARAQGVSTSEAHRRLHRAIELLALAITQDGRAS